LSKQEEIKLLIKTHGIRLNWLAEELNLKTSTLTYLIEESKNFDDDLYDKIKSIIENYQFEFSLFEEDTKDDLSLFNEEALNLSIGTRIRIFAKRKYGTLKSLSDFMEISPQQLQQYVSGKREPGAKILLKLMKAGCDINWILGGEEKTEDYRIAKLENELKKYRSTVDNITHSINKLSHNG